MVEVAHAVPVVARIFIAAEANLWCLFVSPCQSSSLVIITADVCGIHLVGSAFICFCGEVGPAGERFAMIDYHVGYGADALALEGADHGAQFGFVAERAIVIAEPIEVVISHGTFAAGAVGALRNPYQAEVRGEVVCLSLKVLPLRCAV